MSSRAKSQYWLTPSSLNRKYKTLGITFENVRERKKELTKVRIPNSVKNDACAWCQAEFTDNWVWESMPQEHTTNMYFLKESDALVFKLRFATA